MATADDIVEDEPDDRPGHVVERGCGRDETGAVEDDGEVDVLEERVWPLERDEVADERQGGTNEEEEHKPAAWSSVHRQTSMWHGAGRTSRPGPGRTAGQDR